MIIYFFNTMLVIVSYFLIGYMPIKILRIKLPVTSIVSFFAWISCLGFILSSIIIALIFSYGKTIALAGIPPLIFLFYLLKKITLNTNHNLKKINKKEIIGIFIVIIFFYLYNYFYFLNGKNYNTGDTFFRADVSNLMMYLNKETISSYDLLKSYKSTYIAYHYMYLWNNGLISHILTKKDPLISYLYILNPSLLILCVLLFYSILRVFIDKIYLALLLSVIVWFFPFINYSGDIIYKILSFVNININKWNNILSEEGFPLNYPIIFNLYQVKSINLILIFFFLIFTYLINERLSLPICGISLIFSPLILTFPLSFFAYQLLNYKFQKIKDIFLIPLFLFIYLFVLLFILNNNNKTLFNSFLLYPFMCEFKYTTIINYIGVVIISFLVFGFVSWISVFLYLFIVSNKQKSSIIDNLIKIMISLLFFTMLIMTITYGNINSCQYITFNFIFFPFISFIILSYFFNYLINTYLIIKKHLFLLITLTFILIAINVIYYHNKNDIFNSQHKFEEYFDKKQCLRIFQHQNKQKYPIKIGIINGFSYINHWGDQKTFILLIPSLYIKESYFSFYPYRYKIVSVILDTIPNNIQMFDDKCLNIYYYESLKNFLPFDIFFKQNDKKVSIDTIQINFIRKERIQYILLMNRLNSPIKSLPHYLRNFVKSYYVPNTMKQDTLFEIDL